MDRIEKLKEFLALNPQDSFLQHALALEYVKSGDDEEARKLFEQILNFDDSYIGSYYHLVKLLERQDQKGEAIKWCEKGMLKAKEAGDGHAFNELNNAYDDLVY